MNFLYNGVKIYGLHGDTKHSLDISSSESEGEDDLLLRYCNPSPPPHRKEKEFRQIKVKEEKEDKNPPKIVIDQPPNLIKVKIKEEPISPPFKQSSSHKRSLLSPQLEEIRKKLHIELSKNETSCEREIDPRLSFLASSDALNVANELQPPMPPISPPHTLPPLPPPEPTENLTSINNGLPTLVNYENSPSSDMDLDSNSDTNEMELSTNIETSNVQVPTIASDVQIPAFGKYIYIPVIGNYMSIPANESEVQIPAAVSNVQMSSITSNGKSPAITSNMQPAIASNVQIPIIASNVPIPAIANNVQMHANPNNTQLPENNNTMKVSANNLQEPAIKIKTEFVEEPKRVTYSITAELSRQIKTEPLPDNIESISQSIDFPCIGLDYVCEIQRTNPLHDIIFRCDLCNAKCGQRTILLHLKSFKHHLRCLRKFRNHVYEKFRYQKKQKIADVVENHIKDLEKELGRGKMKLKPVGYEGPSKVGSDSSSDELNSKEKSASKSKSHHQSSQKETPITDKSSSLPLKQENYPPISHYMQPPVYYQSPFAGPPMAYYPAYPSNSASRLEELDRMNPTKLEPYHGKFKPKMKLEYEDVKNFVQPDKSKSDFYCPLCDSHMSTEQIWESHIVGKRHRKNLKKQPGEKPSKIKTVKRDDIDSHLNKELVEMEDAIVGLDYISENRKCKGLGPTYSCYLCSGCFTTLNILDHLLTSKHRLKYMQAVDPERHELMMNQNFSKLTLESVVEGAAYEYEAQYGRGNIEVRLEVIKD